ncbi:hypothetical protein DFH08DRAFT_816430 [Mycena albidolilacea]|uniref:Cyanovirin-N domain-containing protein n=1 Tax=Mycena albidolilacea TaxID=1033008 RepID=A0AAD7EIS8_9AGAR|nr:hypothetical protein DFH08DRAFT_816430 [Mycena albidolilacea]
MSESISEPLGICYGDYPFPFSGQLTYAKRAIDSAQLPRLNEPSQVDWDTHPGRWKFTPKFNQPDMMRIESPSSLRAKVRSVMNTPLFYSGGVGYTRQHGHILRSQKYSSWSRVELRICWFVRESEYSHGSSGFYGLGYGMRDRTNPYTVAYRIRSFHSSAIGLVCGPHASRTVPTTVEMTLEGYTGQYGLPHGTVTVFRMLQLRWGSERVKSRPIWLNGTSMFEPRGQQYPQRPAAQDSAGAVAGHCILSAPLEKSVVTRVIDDGFSDVCHGNAVTSNGVLTSTWATTGSGDIPASLSLDSCIGNINGQLTPGGSGFTASCTNIGLVNPNGPGVILIIAGFNLDFLVGDDDGVLSCNPGNFHQ